MKPLNAMRPVTPLAALCVGIDLLPTVEKSMDLSNNVTAEGSDAAGCNQSQK